MWSPTHVQVTVVRASNLLLKGKNGTNDAFVTIGLGKERYQTSVKEKSTDPIQWNEECELSIPKHGNSAEIVLTALHRNFIGDDFLGTVRIPLSDFDVSQYQSTFSRFYPLQNKTGKDNSKKRGELEVKITFVLKPSSNVGSLSDLSKKESHRSSFGQFVGGSLLSLGKEKKGLKKLAKAVGNKVSTLPGRKKKVKGDGFGTIPEQYGNSVSKQSRYEADPGVISDDEDDFRFDELSHKSSHSSLSVSHVAISTPKDGSLENLGGGEFLRKSYVTPPPRSAARGQSPAVVPDVKPVPCEPPPIDEWEAKLFGKQHNTPKSTGSSSSPAQGSLSSSPAPVPKHDIHRQTPKLEEKPTEIIITSPVVKPVPVKDPIPKPRQVQGVINSELKARSASAEDLTSDKGKKTRSLTSLFSSTKPKNNDDASVNSVKPSPIGVSTPIRQPETVVESRLPKETLKKFEGKTREDLIEMVLGLEGTVDQQKRRLGEMHDYIGTILLRVINTSPTILESPYVVCTKESKMKQWDF